MALGRPLSAGALAAVAMLALLYTYWEAELLTACTSCNIGGSRARKQDWGGLDWRAWLAKIDEGDDEFVKRGDADMVKWNYMNPPEGFEPMYVETRGDFSYDARNMSRGLQLLDEEEDASSPSSSSSYTKVIYKKNILLVGGLHSCWAHALLDNFAMMVQGVKRFGGEPFVIWFKGKSMMEYPDDNLVVKPANESPRYNDTRGDLCDILDAEEVIFEHLFDEGDHILVRDSTVVEISPGKVHSPWLLWDDSRIYGGRPFRGDLRIPDAVRYVAYREMVDFVLERLNLKTSKVGTDKSKEVTIMQRRKGMSHRKFSNKLIEYIKQVVMEHGFEEPVPVAFEDIPFRDQVDRIRQSRIIIAMHGAGLANEIFAHPDTIVYEVSDFDRAINGNSHFYDWPCFAVGCVHIHSLRMQFPPLGKVMKELQEEAGK